MLGLLTTLAATLLVTLLLLATPSHAAGDPEEFCRNANAAGFSCATYGRSVSFASYKFDGIPAIANRATQDRLCVIFREANNTYQFDGWLVTVRNTAGEVMYACQF
jgi:hypothetical protein